MSYFYLVQLYGDVPLYLDEIKDPSTAQQPRAPAAEVYAQVKKDLDAAIPLLPLKSALTGSKNYEKSRPTKGAALALKAELHLLLEEWQAAADAAGQVIASNQYRHPAADYVKNFQGRDENGRESVFEIQYTDNALARGSILNTWYGLPGLVQGNGRYGSPTTDDTQTVKGRAGATGNGLVQAFEPTDIRKAVAISTYNGAKNPLDPTQPSFWMCNKYFVGTATLGEARSYVNVPLIRYAKTLLTRAEALNELGAANAEAIALVNGQLRSRAGLPALPATTTGDQAAFRQAIWQERRVELCFEAQRYFDLLRTGQLLPILEGKQKITINRARVVRHPVTQKDWYLLPIPQTEIDNNPLVKQNPGY